MGRFPSGQREQTVNLLSPTSVVRIHLFPPKEASKRLLFLFVGGWISCLRQVRFALEPPFGADAPPYASKLARRSLFRRYAPYEPPPSPKEASKRLLFLFVGEWISCLRQVRFALEPPFGADNKQSRKSACIFSACAEDSKPKFARQGKNCVAIAVRQLWRR